MKKTIALALTTILLAACAGNQNIKMLSKNAVGTMTTAEVASFYKASNKDLLDTLIYEKGGSNYDRLTSVFNNMNTELTNMANNKTPISKEDYYTKLKTVVAKYRDQVKLATK
ncbi:F0F1-type ATP synthase alpha subunit [Elusimicrobium simillimum]|uniref:hypothetical protein n=1 Tax=Elusimicrobium simillimum TaxID=3143438 RepID=UPI003C6FA85A